MKAAWYEKKGPPYEVFQVGELPEPAPGPGEVRVRVHVSAVNPSDTKQRSGWGGNTAMPFPRIVPHNDGAGEIESVGPGVSAARVGERVWVYEAQRDGRAFGTAAECVVVPAGNAIILPSGASFDDGASLGVPGMTAHRLLFADGGLQGKNVLVAGGAGSVGHMAVQLARWAGAKVVATVGSDAQAEVAQGCGAHHVINYKRQDVAGATARFLGGENAVDRIVEVAFAANAELDAAMIRPNGTIATFNIHDSDPRPAVALLGLLIKDVQVRFTLVYAMPAAAHAEAARDLNEALRSGALRPRIAGRFALEDIADVHERLGTGGMGGKAVLQIQ